MIDPCRPPPDTDAALGITRLADLTGLDTIGLPVWSAVRPGAWSFCQSQGKGLTEAQARLSARMEACESALAETAYRLAVASGTAAELAARGHRVIDLRHCLSCRDPDLALGRPYPWLRGQGLVTTLPVLVPLPLVSLDFRAESAASMQPFVLGSSGLAAQVDRTLALRHALLEAIETDALALARSWPGILDCAPIPVLAPDPAREAIHERLAAAGVTPSLRDITSDTGLPTVLCWLTDGQGVIQRTRPFAGSACRLTLEDAARDAMLEAVQTRLTDISGAREDILASDYDMAPSRPTAEARPVASLARPAQPSGAGADLALILKRLQALGLPEPVAVDLAQNRTDPACVKVLCPGLESGPADAGHRQGPRARARLLRHAMGLG
jgi:ribosomal protein S12 methylthiotransferase accessory factor